ncbi:MAG: polysaccharide biosynthesis protein [Betaproteobacteria bacterium]|nr:polysaccharide biosynthesis protein [Betaproteobacteria bacterium]
MHGVLTTVLDRLLAGPRSLRVGIYVAVDACIAMLAFVAAVMLRFEEFWIYALDPVLVVIPISAVATVGAFALYGLYRAPIRFANSTMLYKVVAAGTLASLVTSASLFVLQAGAPYRTVMLITWGLLVGLPGIVRLVIRDFLALRASSSRRVPVAIYGAGEAGVQLADALVRSKEFRPVAFIDDLAGTQGQSLRGLTVYKPDALKWLIDAERVKDVLVAIPSLSRARQLDVMNLLSRHPVRVRAVPALEDIASGRRRVDELRRIEITDILGRDVVAPMPDLIRRSVEGKSVLVTGAGGSIGSELCRQILRYRPSRLVLVESSELSLYNITQETQKERAPYTDTQAVPILANVCDRAHMARVMQAWKVDVVFHAAAYKHVPIVEMNASEGVRNNVFGTLHCALAAADAGVGTFILVSTDKAVRPTNVMGASKRFAEMILQGLAERGGKTRYSMVRFGNVLDSSGSVVPLFKEQIARGGPITVTHPEATRYFMTIPEAASLVIQTGALGQGGDVFVLDMGEPVKIDHLARRMVHLAGIEVREAGQPQGDIEIHYVGLRPGEKLYEELLIGDNVVATEHPMIMRAMEEKLPWEILQRLLTQAELACAQNDVGEVRNVLRKAVSGYRPSDGASDWAFGPSASPLRLLSGGRDE